MSTTPFLFEDAPDRKLFRLTYQGAPRLLREYLLERYAYGRDAAWRESFYPRRVRLNGEQVGAGTTVAQGGRISYCHLREEEPPAPRLPAPLYEDPWMVVLHKPDTIPVNPSGIYYFSSMALLAREQLGLPGLTPVHRLDLETAGPVIFTRHAADARGFHDLFHAHAIHKRYRALTHGRFPEAIREISGHMEPDPDSAIFTKLRLTREGPPGAIPSLTRLLGVTPRGPYSEVELEPVTGKTNQLRVHLASVGHPIVGDKKYHPDEAVFLDWLEHRDFARLRERLHLPSQALLCEELSLRHPFTREPLRLRAPPGSWECKIAGLKTGNGEAGENW